MQTPHIVQVASRAWKNWRLRRAQLIELEACDPSEQQRIAQDIGVSVRELRVLAGRDNSTADLLRRRLSELKIDPAKIDPPLLRDLERCCSNCESKALCEHELDDKPKEAKWPSYCPNEQTLTILTARRRSERR